MTIATRGRGRPPGVNQMELQVRRDEAIALVTALRVIAQRWELLAIRDLGPEAQQTAAQLRYAADRYAAKWTEVAA